MSHSQDNELTKVRIDKWLWAARFFKTRALAKKAIEGGKIHCDGQRVKPSKDVQVGMTLAIRQGWDEKIVEIKRLSDQRRGAPEAQTLYEETQASIEKREREADARKAANASMNSPQKRPTKKDRREIHRLKQGQLD